MIKPVERDNLMECISVIRDSFKTVADEFGFTEENAPRFTAFATNADRLYYHFDVEKRPMFAFFDNEKIIGYYSLLIKENDEIELNNLCVLPEYRHRKIGEELLLDSIDRAKKLGCRKMTLGIVEENTLLKNWYIGYGFRHIKTEKYDFFPFTCGYMERHI